MYPPSLDFIVAFLACLKVGVVAVPVFPPNPARRDTLQMFSKITESSGSRFALTSKEYNHIKKLAGIKDVLTRFKRPGGSWPENLTWISTDDRSSPSNMAEIPALTPQDSDLAFLQYTSGSTSEPKGVMITHGNLAHNLTMIIAELKATRDTVVVSWLPQYHDMGLIGSYLGIIYCGGTGFYLSPISFLQRPMLWMESVSKYQATHLQAPNFAFKLTSRKFRPVDYVNKPLNFERVRHIINAAEPVDEDSMEAFYEAFGPFGLKRVIFPTYGLAEHTVFVCSGGKQILSVKKATLEMDGLVQVVNGTDGDSVTRLVGCGFPEVDVRIVDYDTCQELGEDRVGEIWITSKSKAAGYYGKRNESKQDFHARLKDSPSGHGGFLKTGDLGFRHKKELFICGRLKDLIIIGGRNYYPQDLEATAETTSEKIRPGCSAAFTIDQTNSGGEEVALIMELREIPPANQAEDVCNTLANAIRGAITQEHSLGISQVVFLRTKTVPKTTSGKIARSWCRKAFLAGTLQVVYKKSFGENVSSLELEKLEALTSPIAGEKVTELRALSNEEIVDKLRLDVSRIGQVPLDSVDSTTALVTILDSLSISQFKGRFESAYAVRISDDYLFGETTTLTKLAEIVKLGYAPDDIVATEGEQGNALEAVTPVNHGNTDGIAGALGCPPGVVCCVVQ